MMDTVTAPTRQTNQVFFTSLFMIACFSMHFEIPYYIGTAACSDNTFHCLNFGYKVIQIPSSRVDDGICDCCDGSDEGNLVNCTNICKSMADRDRAKFEKIINSFQTGHATRSEYIKNTKEKHAAAASAIPTIEARIIELKALEEKWSKEKERENVIEENERTLLMNTLRDKVLSVIGVADIASIDTALIFLRGVLDTLAISASDVKEYSQWTLISHEEAKGKSQEELSETSDVEDLDEPSYPSSYDDEYSDGVTREADDYGEAEVVKPSDLDEEAETIQTDKLESNVDKGSSIIEEVLPTKTKLERVACNLGEHSSDLRLSILCSQKSQGICEGQACVYDVSIDTIKHLIFNIAIEKHSNRVLHILASYWRIHDSFEGFDQFADSLEASLGNLETIEVCPEAFSVQPSLCMIGAQMKEFASASETIKAFSRQETVVAKTTHDKIENDLKSATSELNSYKSFVNEVDKFKDTLEFLDLKNQCFDAIDGKFTYSLCMLTEITQSENGGSNKVRLGTYKELKENEDGSFDMIFDAGQYCHAHGPRMAAVNIVCGAENILSDASEPSTCFYTFRMESPAACSVNYGRINHLVLI